MKKRMRPKIKRAASRSSPELSTAMKALGKLARQRLQLSNEPAEQVVEGQGERSFAATCEVTSHGPKLTRVKPKVDVPTLAESRLELDVAGAAPAKLSVVGKNGNV